MKYIKDFKRETLEQLVNILLLATSVCGYRDCIGFIQDLETATQYRCDRCEAIWNVLQDESE